MSVVWRKIWRDLAHNKARTALVVLSTAVGVFALGLVFGLSGVLRTQILESHRASVPAHVTFWGGPFSPGVVEAIGREPGVAATEGEMVASFRWKLAGEGEWRDGDLVARADYGAQRISLLRLLDGRWPDGGTNRLPSERALGVERLSSRYFDLPVGATVLVEFGEHGRRLPVEGIVSAPVVLPPEWGGDALFYATPETAAWLSGARRGEEFNRLNVLLESYSHEGAGTVAERIEDRLERMGLSVGGYEISDPNEHWVQDIVDATMMVLMIIGVLSLGLSGFLIVNTMSAILVQQHWQIGVMKAVGATSGRVLRIYLAIASIYGALAVMLAVPLAALGAHLLATWLLDLFNVEQAAFLFNPAAIGLQVAVGLAVPLLAAVGPALGGARVTVREAIAAYGLGGRFGQGWLDSPVARMRRLPRPLALSIRNAFRRKLRVALTLITLTFSGAMFTVVMSTGASLDNTIMTSFSVGEDVAVTLDRLRRTSRAVEIAESVPGVAAAEVWREQAATLLLAGSEEHPVGLAGVPPDSSIFAPHIVEGRNLRPGDGHALVFTSRLAEEEGVGVGDAVTVNIGDGKTEWTVVGLYLSIDDVSDVFFVSRDVLGQETGAAGRGRHVKVLSERDDPASQEALIRALEEAFAEQRIEVVDSWSSGAQLEESRASFGILTSVLLVMVLLTALVGGIGLMGTMSMNVVERRREIGVMRAIGASSPTIVGMFVAEGVLVGALSWLVAVPFSLPGARLFSDVIGQALLAMPLDFVYSTGGMALWLGIVALLSALSSLWPALRATEVSVRQSLAYE